MNNTSNETVSDDQYVVTNHLNSQQDVAYVTGSLKIDDQLRMYLHLARCRSCRKRIYEMQQEHRRVQARNCLDMFPLLQAPPEA
jgi:anti-sigma factor RsiW